MRELRELIYFLDNTMSMTDVYQPAVILHLLESGGTATKTDLATTLSGYDNAVQEYYEKVLMRWPKITLTKHDVVEYDRKSKTFSLTFSLNDAALVRQAKMICERRIKEWISRKAAKGGPAKAEASVRYRVLKAARGRCELCGISSKIEPIDIDHIVPESHADPQGYIIKDGIRMNVHDERNLQALCFRCNRAKRDQDDTDFRLPVKKLVRDKIPELITNDGRIPITKRLKGKELTDQLLEKLTEEHAELISTTTVAAAIEEIADMMEILFSIAKISGYTEEQTMAMLYKKRLERGGFDRGVFLEDVKDEVG
jgi:predicted house-cleaning noncanonical NTP pyrophosphatase (MazG superfamily)